MNYQSFRESQKSFKSSEGIIKYIDKGKGDVLLLIHGVPTSSWLYRKMIDRLVAAGNRVIVPDMLGYGSSESPKGYDIYSQKEHAKRILELMDSLAIEEWNHVMHDAGGLWTWEIFKKSPERIKKLVVLNTIIFEEGFHPPMKMKKGWLTKFIMQLYMNRISVNILLKSLFNNGLKINNLTKDELEGYRVPLLEGKTNGLYYFFSQTCNDFPEYNSVIEHIKIPILIIWGQHDNMLEWEPQKAKVIKGLNVELSNIHLLDAKHFIQEEKPEEINSLILKHIEPCSLE